MSFSGKNSRRSFLKLSVLSGLTAGFGRSAVAEPEEREESAPVTAAARDLDIVDFRCRPPIKPMKMLFDMKLGRQKWPSDFANPLAKSVSKSMRTSREGMWKGLNPASRMIDSRSSRDVIRIGSTTLMRKGSMMVFIRQL